MTDCDEKTEVTGRPLPLAVGARPLSCLTHMVLGSHFVWFPTRDLFGPFRDL
jgi:hypothetical protein